MAIQLNLAGISAVLEAVPPDTYPVVVSQCRLQDSKASGQPMLAWRLRIESPEEFAGRLLFHNTSLQKQALWNLKRTLLALGYEEEELDSFEFDPEEVVGLTCQVVVTVETDPNGVERNKIVALLTDEGAAPIGAAQEAGAELAAGVDFDF